MAAPRTIERAVDARAPRARRGVVLLLLVGLAVLAWQSIAFGFGLAMRKSNPEQAVRLAPNNALVLAAVAQLRLADDPAQAELLARRALRRDPANALAASTLGLSILRSGQTARSARLLNYAMMMSRRDSQSQLWAIEAAVDRGDIDAALRHYDIALRVGKSMPTVLFPVLAAASNNPAIDGPLSRMLAAGVPWGSSFLDYLSTRTDAPAAASDLLRRILAAGGRVPRAPVAVLVQRLVDVNESRAAWELYAQAEPRAAHGLVRNADFRRLIDLPTPFDWKVEDGADVRGEILPDASQGALHVEAKVGAGGSVARQRLVLPPGRYGLSYSARAAEDATLGDSSVDLTCLPAGPRIAAAMLAPSSGDQRAGVAFTVPPGCADQLIEIRLDAGGEEKALEGWITRVAVTQKVIPPLH